MAKKYQDFDITVYCKSAHHKIVERLSKYCKVKLYRGEKIVCDKVFFNYNTDIIDNVEAKEYVQVFHTDYIAQGFKLKIHPKITRLIGVSKIVCESVEKLTGRKCELMYNPIDVDKPNRVLKLVSATRLTKEKGKERMIRLANMLDKANIPYIWLVFTNDGVEIKNPSVCYMQPRQDISHFIKEADYLVQLSDEGEGFGYAPVESLCLGTPVIVTPCTAFKEIGVINGENGYIVNFDLSNIDLLTIYKNVLKFKYEPPRTYWEDVLQKGEKEEEEMKKYVLKVKETFTWSARNNNAFNEGDLIETTSENEVEYLTGLNPLNRAVVDIVKEEPIVETEKVTTEKPEVKKAVKKTTKKSK